MNSHNFFSLKRYLGKRASYIARHFILHKKESFYCAPNTLGLFLQNSVGHQIKAIINFNCESSIFVFLAFQSHIVNTKNKTAYYVSYLRLVPETQYIYQDSILFAYLMQWYTKVYLFLSWLVWGRNQVYCTCVSAKTAHKQIGLVIAKQTKGAKSLLF